MEYFPNLLYNVMKNEPSSYLITVHPCVQSFEEEVGLCIRLI